MDNVVLFPESPVYFAQCTECGGTNFALEVEGEPWDIILAFHCLHCKAQRMDKFGLVAEVEDEKSST